MDTITPALQTHAQTRSGSGLLYAHRGGFSHKPRCGLKTCLNNGPVVLRALRETNYSIGQLCEIQKSGEARLSPCCAITQAGARVLMVDVTQVCMICKGKDTNQEQSLSLFFFILFYFNNTIKSFTRPHVCWVVCVRVCSAMWEKGVCCINFAAGRGRVLT